MPKKVELQAQIITFENCLVGLFALIYRKKLFLFFQYFVHIMFLFYESEI